MNYLLAFLCPPLYFFTRGKWIAGIINGCFYLLGLMTVMFGFGAFFLACCIIHAMADVRKADAQYVADQTATRVNQAVKDALASQQVDPTKNY